jgi:hypothetical protein
MAAVLISSRRTERGIMECERALALNPSLASAHAMLLRRKAREEIRAVRRILNQIRRG